MNINGLLQQAESNKKNRVEKRFSLDVGPAKKLPKRQVDPNAIKALLERREKEKQGERDKLITKAVELGKRDEVNYKDRKGIRKEEQQRSDKSKRQWLKLQKERRDFIDHMHRAADARDKARKPLVKEETVASFKKKSDSDTRRKRRKLEPLVETVVNKKPKVKARMSDTPRVTDINELMRIATENAEKKAFAADYADILTETPKKSSDKTERLLTNAEKRRIQEEEAIMKKRASVGLPKIPKIGAPNEPAKTNGSTKSNGSTPSKLSKKVEKDRHESKNESAKRTESKSSKDGMASNRSKSTHQSNGQHKPKETNGSKKRPEERVVKPSQNGHTKQNHAESSVRTETPTKSKKLSTSEKADQITSSEKEKIARKLAQLQRERQAEEEAERRKRLQAKKERMAEEGRLKKKLKQLQYSNASVMDSDVEDEDEDLDAYEDDFIDDAPIDDPYAKQYSKTIAQIFKYDKRKYLDMDDDDIEESSFTRCMAEEARSARLGRQEDLEDMRKEEEELKRKTAKNRKLEELSKKLKQKKKLTLCEV